MEAWSLLSWERGLKYAPYIQYAQHEGVAPLVGAWIEIILIVMSIAGIKVAPLVGAWIEIDYCNDSTDTADVAPLVGAWIEISLSICYRTAGVCRSSRGSVD